MSTTRQPLSLLPSHSLPHLCCSAFPRPGTDNCSLTSSRIHRGTGTRTLAIQLTFAFALLLLAPFLSPFCPCSTQAQSQPPTPIPVTTTVTMVSDLVQQIGRERVTVSGLMGPGVDPHLYKATALDLRKLSQAKIIFYSGLHLEGKLQETLTRIRSQNKPVVAVTDAIPKSSLLSASEAEGSHDPHVWFDVELWIHCIGPVVETLSKVDPEGKEFYARNGEDLRKHWSALHQWAKAKASELPVEKRILITSHDAFNYFGKAYGFQVVALQGISTVAEAGLADVARLVDYVKAHRVRAVFVESSVLPTTMQRIQKDAGVTIGGELFSDAMGTPGQMEDGADLGTYEGMIRHNLNTIVRSLR